MIIRRFLLLLPLGAVLIGFAATRPAFAAAAPPGVQAYYMFGATVTGLKSEAYADACNFAANQPDNQTYILLLDFGAARMFPDGTPGRSTSATRPSRRRASASPSRRPPTGTTTAMSKAA